MNSVTSTHSFCDPISQFQNLSKRASKTQRKSMLYEKPRMSPREEIYKSMIREIRNVDSAQMNSLVHKASGILRLTHFKDANKGRNVTVSWDIDGRRVLTYEDSSGQEQSMLQRQTAYDRKTKKGLLASLNEPIFGLDSMNLKVLSEYVDTKSTFNNNGDTDDGQLPASKVSKVWEDYIETGDTSKLWESKEGILTESRSPSAVGGYRSSATSINDNQSVITNVEARPPWKTCYSSPSKSSNYVSTRDSFHSTSSLPSMTSSKGVTDKRKNSSTSYNRRTQSSSTIEENDKEKVDHIQHICVVNGSVVAFKNFGSENFTNWFGDETTMESNQQRSQPKIHMELDLSHVKSKDIKIRLLDGCKLEIEAKRRVPGTPKPIRKKEIVIIPEGFRAEDLLMCRTKNGKLVVEEITPAPVPPTKPSNSKVKSLNSRPKWQTSRK